MDVAPARAPLDRRSVDAARTDRRRRYHLRRTRCTGSDGHPDQWRGSSTALAGWALAVEAGVGSECLWGLLITSAVAIAVSRLFTSTPRGVLVGDTLRAFLTAAFYAITPALWMISRPACSDESADVKIGS